MVSLERDGQLAGSAGRGLHTSWSPRRRGWWRERRWQWRRRWPPSRHTDP
jgi:hypothetical protein